MIELDLAGNVLCPPLHAQGPVAAAPGDRLQGSAPDPLAGIDVPN